MRLGFSQIYVAVSFPPDGGAGSPSGTHLNLSSLTATEVAAYYLSVPTGRFLVAYCLLLYNVLVSPNNPLTH